MHSAPLDIGSPTPAVKVSTGSYLVGCTSITLNGLAFDPGWQCASIRCWAAIKCYLPCLRLGSLCVAQVDQLAGEILRRVLPEGVKL